MTWAQLEERTNRAALRAFGSTQDAPVKLDWKPVSGDLIEAGDEVFLGGVSVEATQTMFVMATPDVPVNVIGLPLQQGQRSFTVQNTRADGRGMTTLFLEVAQ